MKKTWVILVCVLVAGMLFSCSKNPNFDGFSFDDGNSPAPVARPDRTPTHESRRVLILYSAGFNSLAGFLKEDIEDLAKGFVPDSSRNANVLLVISRHTDNYGHNYNIPMPTVLMRLVRENGYNTVMDTLKVWEPDKAVTSASFMSEALQFVADEFPAAGYGMIYSSHGTGWLPRKYYANPSIYDPHYNADYSSEGQSIWSAPGKRRMAPAIPEFPAVKTLGQDEGSPYSELELKDLPSATPIHLEYLIVDACLMGGVEFAYELKDVCDKVAFSQTEVLAEGINYTTVASHLLEKPVPDVKAVCLDYFNQYDTQTGSSRSATISLIDCRKLDALADVCTPLFSKYRTQIYNLNSHTIQEYFRASRYFFFDLQDILLHSGINQEESRQLQKALDDCVLFKAATPQFLGIDIKIHSGLSMYLPAANSSTPYLNSYYMDNVSWNTRTNLVL